MAGRLAGKVVLITGAARGIGAATARLCAQEGAQLLLTDVLAEDVQQLAEELGDAVHAAKHDVTSGEDWASVVAAAEDRFGHLDGLFNNAGIVNMVGLEATTREVWDRILEVNQTGVWLGLKATVPALRRTGGGSIVNASSIYGLIGSGGATAYQATKGAVRLLSKTAAVEFAADGIRINSIHPGIIATPMMKDVPPEAQEQLVALTPMGRMGQPEEIGATVVFLLSAEASFITGAEIVIDGGFTTQ